MPPLSTTRRRAVLILAAPLALAVVPRRGMAGIFPFIPNHYTFTRRQIEAAVQRKFPYHRRIAQLFDMTLSDAVLTLLPDTNRVGVSLDARIESPFLQQPVLGAFTLDTQLAYDSQRTAVVLHDPRVDKIDLTGVGGGDAQQVTQAAALVATQLLDGYPIYTFKPSELSFAGVHYAPGAITVLSNGIRVDIVEQ